ncbi:MAG: sensor histidine kinase [Candidatus Promineifilaceae bacterium]
MNRLWIRFSFIISGLILLVILLPLGTVATLQQFKIVNVINDDPGDPKDARLDLDDAAGTLFAITAVVGIMGAGLGIALSRGLSAPIVELAAAAKQIGAGDLSQRVPVRSSSRELIDLAHSFNAMASDLQHGEALRSSMLADVSHELRTPLTVLSGQLRAALDDVYTLDEEGIANLYGQTQHLIRLVNDLHLLARAEARQLPLHFEAVDLYHISAETVENFATLAEEKNIALTLQGEAQLVQADTGRLRQIITNLVGNAIRHTPHGGQILLHLSDTETQATIAVTDSGEGIAQEHLEHLFDRFYRADKSRTRGTGGSGLGLAIARALIEGHDGTIAAESAGVGKGSTFTIQLPKTNRNDAP